MTDDWQPDTTTVLVVGPSPEMTGGMASVVSQVSSLDFRGNYRIELLPITVSTRESEPLAGRVLRHLGRVRLLRKRISELRVGIVHIHTCSGFSFFRSLADLVVARNMGCRVILHIHGAAFDDFHESASPRQRLVIGWGLAHADRVIALSDGWREKLNRMSTRGKIVVVENAVDIPPSSNREIVPGPCRFVLLAKMDAWKGIDDLLDACALLHREGVWFDLTLAGPPGSAGDESTLGKKIGIRRLGDVVRYVGTVQGDEKRDLLGKADVYVQPSHNEGMPISLLEALASGLPVVATRVGAVPEVLTDNREGFLIPPHQPVALAESMRELALDAHRRLDMSRASYRLARTRFSTTRLCDDLMSLYDDLMSPCDDLDRPSKRHPRIPTPKTSVGLAASSSRSI